MTSRAGPRRDSRPVRRARLSEAVFAALTYAGAVFAAGAVLGTFRELMVTPRTGVSVAVAIETPIMIAVSIALCRWVFGGSRPFGSRADRVITGIGALTLLVGLEDCASQLLRHRSLLELWSTMPGPALACTLAGLLVFAALPAIIAIPFRSRR